MGGREGRNEGRCRKGTHREDATCGKGKKGKRGETVWLWVKV